MASNHTPTPWSRNIPPISKYSVIFSGRNKHVFSFRISHLGQVDQAEIDCDFMLEAVNAYEANKARLSELEAALREQIAAHAKLCKAAGLDEQAHLDGTAQARAALEVQS